MKWHEIGIIKVCKFYYGEIFSSLHQGKKHKIVAGFVLQGLQSTIFVLCHGSAYLNFLDNCAKDLCKNEV